MKFFGYVHEHPEQELNKGVGHVTIVNDFSIPEYPEADLWIEELLKSSMTVTLERGN